jgi:hypothetical protein
MQGRQKETTAVCQICKKQKTLGQMVPGEVVRKTIVETIQKTHPDWSPAGFTW